MESKLMNKKLNKLLNNLLFINANSSQMNKKRGMLRHKTIH